LTELVDIDSVSKAVDESRESNQSIFCDSLKGLENKDEQFDNIAGCLRVQLVPRLYQDNLQETCQVVLVLSSFLLSEILQVRAQSVLQKLEDWDQHRVEMIINFLSCRLTKGVKGCETGKGKVS
jgi:hypothetical protein